MKGSTAVVRSPSIAAVLLAAISGCDAPGRAPAPQVVIVPEPAVAVPTSAPAQEATASSRTSREKVAECNALITIINRGVTIVEKAPSSDPGGVTALERMAEQLEKIAREVERAPITLPELAALAAEYRTMMKDIAKAERALASALWKPAAGASGAASSDLERATKREDALIGRINDFCQQP